MGKLLNTKEAAEKLGISAKTLNTWRCTKRYPLPYVKVGHLVKYREEDIQEFIETQLKNG